MHTKTISNARREFLELPKEVQEEPLFITKHGKAVMTLLSIEQFEGMQETIEILRDQVFSRRLQHSVEQARAGKTLTMDEVMVALKN